MIRSDISNSHTASQPRILVFGNQKGGSGKSTLAMHCAIGLLRLGFSVGSIDLDSDQRSFSRYLKNRFAKNRSLKESDALRTLPMPTHITFAQSDHNDRIQSRLEDGKSLLKAIEELNTHDFIIIDTAGYNSYIQQFAHSLADTIITPINDSFIDLDLIADIDQTTKEIKGPSGYSEMVWKQRQAKMSETGKSIDWIIMRNRLEKVDNKHSQVISRHLLNAAKRFGFRIAPGFTNRDVFHHMFLEGITLLDWHETREDGLTLDIVQARQEVRSLLETIGLRKQAVSRKMHTPQNTQKQSA